MGQLELKTKQNLAAHAQNLAKSFNLVCYRDNLYVPVQFNDLEIGASPAPDETVWLGMDSKFIKGVANEQYSALFANDGEFRSFVYMTKQCAIENDNPEQVLHVRTPQGLKVLDQKGQLIDPTGEFIPNAIGPVLNEDKVKKQQVFDTISQWVDSEEEAHSLLCHLATTLAPSYSAIRYVLLLGKGRNGKSVLLKMMQKLMGPGNCSHVTRQEIAEKSPTVTSLNGTLLNLVFDGQAEYLKDSGMEKTLIAGELATIRKLYESEPTHVQTNALFVEGLQQEPKSKDKSDALQKRLVRFMFPNVYPQDHRFEKFMLADETLGAFLSLLIDHYVAEDDVAVALAPTQRTIELQLEHMYVNSIALQFLKHIEEKDAMGLSGILNETLEDLVPRFCSWRIQENDVGSYAAPDVTALLAPLLNTERKSKRVDGQPRKVRVITSLSTEAQAFIDTLKGVEDATSEDVAALVAD